MDSKQFMEVVKRQIEEMQAAAVPGVEAWVSTLGEMSREQQIELFKHAGYAEWRSAEANSKHFLATPDDMDDLRSALAMEAHEEYEHFQGFKYALSRLGVDWDPKTYEAVPAWREYFDNIEFASSGLEKIAVENIGGEARAQVWLEQVVTGPNAILREIAPSNLEDEYGHTQIGLKLIEKYATDEAVQQQFLEKARRNQELAILAQHQLNERLGLVQAGAA